MSDWRRRSRYSTSRGSILPHLRRSTIYQSATVSCAWVWGRTPCWGKQHLLHTVLIATSDCVHLIEVPLFSVFATVISTQLLFRVVNRADRRCWLSSYMLFVQYRIDLAKPDQPNQIELGRKDESKVHKLFLDPTGEKATIRKIYNLFWGVEE